MDYNLLLDLLKTEVLPVMGRAEAGSVALAAAYASKALGKNFERISIVVNTGLYRNSADIKIPGTGVSGLEMAAILGAIKSQPEKQLSVLAGITSEELEQGKSFLKRKVVTVTADNSKKNVWIEVCLLAGQESSYVIIKDSYTNIVRISKNGQVIFSQHAAGNAEKDLWAAFREEEVRIADMIAAIEKMPWYEMEFLLDGVEMNCFAAEIGIAKKSGMGIGSFFHTLISDGMLAGDIITDAKMLTSAAADAYMSGENVKIMGCAGSGEFGIIAILPVYAAAKKLGVSKERLARAIAISHGVTIYISIYTNDVSACRVMAAAAGASAGITWLMTGNLRIIEDAIKNIIANFSGKIDYERTNSIAGPSVIAAIAVESSLLAQNHIVIPYTQTMDRTIEEIIINGFLC